MVGLGKQERRAAWDASQRRARRRRRAQQRRRATTAALGLLVALCAVIVVTEESSGHARRRHSHRALAAARTATHAIERPRHVIALGAIPPARPGRAHVFLHGPTAGRMVALTFDDGFCPRCVARIVHTLLRTGAHATFFPNGGYAASWDPQAKQIRMLVERGQVIVGNHTFHHVDAPVVGSAAFSADLRENEQWIERTFGLTGRPFFRPPYGAYDGGTLAAAGAAGYTRVIMWSGTVADSNLRTIPYILHAIRIWARPGAIILMHGNYPPTSIALPRILALLRRMRLRPVTVAELLGGSPYRPAK